MIPLLKTEGSMFYENNLESVILQKTKQNHLQLLKAFGVIIFVFFIFLHLGSCFE